MKTSLPIIALAALLATSTAHATAKPPKSDPKPTPVTAPVSSESNSHATGGASNANATGGASNANATGGASKSYSGVNGSGNSSSYSSSYSGVNGSGNSSSYSEGSSARQQQGQAQGQSARTGSQNTNVDASDNSRSYAFGEGDFIGGASSTAPCTKVNGFKVTGPLDGLFASFGARFDRESGNCITDRRTVMIYQIYGPDAAMIYLAQQDPALWATLVAMGRIVPAERQHSNPLRQSNPPKNNVVQVQPAEQCHIKPGTTRTVITTAKTQAGKMECARQLGLVR